MKKFMMAALAASLVGCTSVESATVSSADIVSGGGEAVAVIQTNTIGFTALFHMIDIVQSDLEVSVNKLLVAEAKGMGANKVELKSFHTSPRHGIWAVFALEPFPYLNLLGFPSSTATGIAVK
jgi:hypothetical protein